MNRAKLISGFAVPAAFVITLISCASGLDSAPKVDSLLGTHPNDWAKSHGSDFLKNTSGCNTCHGSVTDRASSGGISKVSCFNCHHNGVSHTSGFASASGHGRNAAQLVPSSGLTPMAGFASCKKCHGDDYSGYGDAVSCMACHTKAPHPDAPWTGKNIDVVSHTFTAVENMSACAQCHTGGANSTLKPSTAPPPGTPAGCFNNTLCHSRTV